MNALAEQFATVTGATTNIGLRLLEVCNGDLERAISMHLDRVIDVNDMENANAAVQSTAAGPSVPLDDSVRAPIPSKMDTLVEDIPTFGPRPRQRRARQSVFDGLRDFQAETRLQEEMLRNPKSAAKKRTLEDLFRPPLDLMHKGTFVTAREAGQTQGKWLMVNVQNVREFSCQQLNRDVWSDSTVKSIVRESFVFWQVYHDSDEGQRYMQFYKVTDFPYVSILDPRTGEQMATWHRIDNEAFCDVVMQFLCDHKMDIPDVVPLSPPADSPSSSGPPAKRARSASIIDASEESQIEAAIAASLAEAEAAAQAKSDENQTNPKPRVIAIDSDSDINVDDDDDAIETIDSDFAFSDSEALSESGNASKDKRKPTNGATVQNRTSVIIDASSRKDDEAVDDDAIHEVEDGDSGNDVAVVESRTEVDEVKSNGLLKNDDCQRKESSVDEKRTESGGGDEMDAKELKGGEERKGGEARTGGEERESVDEKDNEEEDESDISGPTAKIMLRFPDGRKKQVCLSAAATLKALIRRVAKEGFAEEKYELMTTFPRRRLSALDSGTSLSDAGLCPQESIFVQER